MTRTFTAEENANLRNKIATHLQALFPKSKDHPERFEPIIQASIKWVEDGNCAAGGNVNFEAVDKALRPEVVRQVTKKDEGDLVEELRGEYHRDFCWWLLDRCDIRGDAAAKMKQLQAEKAAKETKRLLKQAAKPKVAVLPTAAPETAAAPDKVAFPPALAQRRGPFD